ncbi:MFS transporter [Bifidobacterium sp.]|jgi:EmrB/QacA subfamily drug resistance transporter|uniref:MFS transporter n=1 Tax=Bifidobacterium sp. TaxID=41200 RepID=UPI0025C50D79|nr:MFS transporter [Bifidobacterium sp.]MCI1634737.1 MFS transporter [Bifidobacterium sp.]
MTTKNEIFVQDQPTQNTDLQDATIPKKLLGAVIATGTLTFIGILTETVMNVLFPVLMKEFSVGTSTIQWLTTGYLLVVSLTVTLSSYFKRRVTLRVQFMIAVSLCLLGAIVAVSSLNFPMLLAARLLQGCGTGIALPLMFNIILEQSPKSKIGQLMGIGNLVCASAPALGPTFGGVVASVMSWRWVFVFIIPFLLVALVVGLRCIEQTEPTVAARFSALQLLTVAIGFTSVLFAIEQIGAAITSASTNNSSFLNTLIVAGLLLILGIAALLIFSQISRKSFSPLIRLGVLASASFRWHLLSYVLFPFITIGLGFVIPTVIQIGLGGSSLTAGLVVLPGAVFGAIMAPLGGMLLDRIGAVKPIFAGFIVAFCGLLLLTVFGTRTGVVALGAYYMVYMLGFSTAYSNIMTDALNELPPALKADGNAMFSTLQQLMGAVGTTVMSVFIAVAQAGHGSTGSKQYATATITGSQYAFVCVSAVVVIAALSMLRAATVRKA